MTNLMISSIPQSYVIDILSSKKMLFNLHFSNMKETCRIPISESSEDIMDKVFFQQIIQMEFQIVIHNNCNIIELNLEELMSLDLENAQSHKKIANQLQKPNSYKKKAKFIKKKMNKRSLRKIKQSDKEIRTLFDLIMESGPKYFNLSQNEIINMFKNKFNSFVHIKNIISQQCTIFDLMQDQNIIKDAQRYLLLANKIEENKKLRLALSSKEVRKYVNFLYNINKVNASSQVVLLNRQESLLMDKRDQMLNELDHFLQQHSPKQYPIVLDTLTKQILALCRLNAIQQRQLLGSINQINYKTAGVLYKIHEQTHQLSNSLQNNYVVHLIIKNISKAFNQAPIDILNYFCQIDYSEKQNYDDTPLELINSSQQLKTYLKYKKPKPGKHPQQSLKTCCSGCFSNYYEMYNPIQTCIECGMRMHRLCQYIKTKCQRCKYIRKTVQEKNHLSYCFICQRQKEQGISLEIVYDEQGQHYAHTFCLLTSRCWKVQRQVINYQMASKLDSLHRCRICCKSNGLCLACICCGERVHGLCSFLEGYSMQISEDGSVQVICCGERQVQLRLSFERKYKMNFEKMLYKNTQQLFKMIQCS